MEKSTEVAIQLTQVKAHMVFGEDQDVVLHPREEFGEEELLFLLSLLGDLLNHVVCEREDPIQVAVENPEADCISLGSSDLEIQTSDPARHLLEEPRHGDGVI